ncbi:DUF4350 domain-containing protein [Maribellus sediminis]|uniref:DUF4350 domain-containing protein n=1 Tax=Maribellus sediminis TaxID=2696285 RepID=UPI0014313264|nr:DUF4350 domain-containing protein [Maribellus sediminis]
MKGYFKYIILIVALFAVLVYLEVISPKDVDWRQTFSARDKIPFGTWVLHDELKSLYPDTKVKDLTSSFYEYQNLSGDVNNSIVIITKNFGPDSLDMDFLFRKAKAGADVFISANYFDDALTDSFRIQIKQKMGVLPDSVTNLRVWNGQGWGDHFRLNKSVQPTWFVLSDSSRAIPLGLGNDSINFVKIPYGDGNFLLHTAPLVFTNYHLLYSDHQYQEQLLSWFSVPTGTLEWDEYYKPFRVENRSPIKMILTNRSLRAAYWTSLIGLLVYVFTNVLRRQRIIPVLKAKNNMSLDFVRTIGLLYYNRKDHKDLLVKIFTGFSETITSRYFLRFEYSEDFYKKLALKSGVSEKITRMIFSRYQILSDKKQVYEDELLQFNDLVEQFYRESKQASSAR